MSRWVTTLGGAAVALATVAQSHLDAQDWTRREFPLAPPNSSGNFVAPYFDGFYRNPDGTWTLVFGFMNRNEQDLVEIPLGPDNFIEPAEFDGGQPTSFPVVSYPGFGGPRERGAFAVVVPSDFQGDVWWTLTTDGYTTKVPGRIRGRFEGVIGFESAYELSTTPQAEGSLRPSLRFAQDGPEGIGAVGIEAPRRYEAKVGEPIEIEFWARDRGERELKEVNMTLWKHQGPVGGRIAFESLVERPADEPPTTGRGGRGGSARSPGPVGIGQSVRLPVIGPRPHEGRFRAKFDTPGEYVIRVRIDNFTTGDSSMGNQCCWTNGYVRVDVTE